MNFILAYHAAEGLYSCLQELGADGNVKAMLEEHQELKPLLNFPLKGVDPRVGALCVMDVIKCFHNMGHRFNSRKEESKILSILLMMITTPDASSVWDNEEGLTLLSETGMADDAFHAFYDNIQIGYDPRRLLLVDLLREGDVDDYLVNRFLILMFRFLLLIAEADSRVTREERKWLGELVSFSRGPALRAEASQKVHGISIPDNNEDPKDVVPKKKRNEDSVKNEEQRGAHSDKSPLEKLSGMVGLENVKREMQKIYDMVKIRNLRLANGLKTSEMSYHCVFTGNPGTGKTTVARILAEIYRELGILKKGHLVETDRSGLIAEYVGQTAVKTNKIIDSALDGVLFIDEAYSLCEGVLNDFGPEAVATLLKRMEDDRNRLVVVVAGYSEEMKNFINTNPGLRSRFNRYIHFDDYSVDELIEIFCRNLHENDYAISSDALKRLRKVIANASEKESRHFGNARFVRNLFEKTLENQAHRIVSIPKLDPRTLSQIEAADIPNESAT